MKIKKRRFFRYMLHSKLILANILFFGIAALLFGVFVVYKIETAPKPPAPPKNFSSGLRYRATNEDLNTYINDELAVCNKISRIGPTRYQCLQNLGVLLSQQFSFKQIVGGLSDTTQDCHDAMHYIVNIQYRKGMTIPQIWSQCTTACYGACYHGGLEGIFDSQKTAGRSTASMEASLTSLCTSLPEKFKDLTYQCYHGLGHAIMILTNGDVGKSLLFCDTLKTNQIDCYDGTFMENLPDVTTFDHINNWIKSSDPIYPCDALAQKYVDSCFTFQIGYIMNDLHYSIPQIITLCSSLPENDHLICFAAIGALSFNKYPYNDYTGYRSVCNQISEGISRQSCINGLVYEYLDFYPENISKMEGAFGFCDVVDTPYKVGCYRQIGSIMQKFLQGEKLLQECDKAPKEYQSVCTS